MFRDISGSLFADPARAVGRCDGHARMRYIEFFTVTIRNPNTRRAYPGQCVLGQERDILLRGRITAA